MKRKDFLAKLESNKGKNLVIEIEGEIIHKVTMEKMEFEVEEDRLYIRDSVKLNFVVINLNTIRNLTFSVSISWSIQALIILLMEASYTFSDKNSISS